MPEVPQTGTTVLVEPFPEGHRLQAVANVGAVASRTSEVLVLTSHGATRDPAYAEYLGDSGFRVLEVFDEVLPPIREIAQEIAKLSRAEQVDTVVVMDADQALKHWWLEVPRAFGLRRRPRVVFMLTRYPAKLRLTDWVGWKLRVPKATLALVTMATGSLHRVAGFAGRDDMSRGWLVKRTRDPQVCSAHSRDRLRIRARHGLPPDRRIVGIYGVITDRKHPALVWEALRARGIEADLLLGGKLADEVSAWVESLPPSERGRVVAVDEFLSNAVLDELVAAADVVALVMTNNGPSGIMGKALAAGVPVVTAGSVVRAREARATDAGEVAEIELDSLGDAFVRALARDPDEPRRHSVPDATVEEFACNLLGVRPATRRVEER